jgi:heptosyltransferase III
LPDSILLISLSNIGDVIMTTPVLQALHEYSPGSRIDIVADSRSSDIFRFCPYRGELFLKHKKGLFRGGWDLLKAVRKNHYDLIVDLRTDGFAYLLRGNRRLTKWHRASDSLHSVEQHMSIIKSIWHQKEIPPCHVWLSKTERDYAPEVLGIYKGSKLLGLGPGANSKKKVWPAERYVLLVERLSDQFDAIIIFGSNRDRAYADYIHSHIHMPCINLCEKTTLLQAAAVQAHIELYIGNDSGLGHMAAAMGKPTMTIFGPGEPERYRPWIKGGMLAIGRNHDIDNVMVDDVVRALENEYFGCELSVK